MDTFQNNSDNNPGDETGDSEVIVDAAPRITASTSTFQSGDHFILGSYQGNLTINRLLEREASNDAFTSFCARLSVAIKTLNPMDAVVIDESHQVRYTY